jgi:hypothetical protein
MISHSDFSAAITGMMQCLPFQKTISGDGLVFAWISFPEDAKAQLEPIHLAYACTQRVLDPEPDLNRAVHIQLLMYLYPVVNGVPVTQHGLRQDISERLQQPHRFHPLSTRAEAQLPVLPPAPAQPPQETADQRKARLEKLAKLTRSATNASV